MSGEKRIATSGCSVGDEPGQAFDLPSFHVDRRVEPQQRHLPHFHLSSSATQSLNGFHAATSPLPPDRHENIKMETMNHSCKHMQPPWTSQSNIKHAGLPTQPFQVEQAIATGENAFVDARKAATRKDAATARCSEVQLQRSFHARSNPRGKQASFTPK